MCAEHVPPALVSLSLRLADAASEAIRPYYRTFEGTKIDAKADLSPVTAADMAAETRMRAILKEEVPSHGIVGEEFGSQSGADEEYTWVLDPIDGTKAFMTGKPTFGTLIALLKGGKPIIGVIDQPISGERWIGVENEGARLNDQVIQCPSSVPARLADANLHATHPDMFTGIERMSFEELSSVCRYTLYGSDCYAYALLAMGHVHLICEADMKPWDYMALVPIIKEAGGVITDWEGQELTMYSNGTVLAAVSRELHCEAVELLQVSPRGIILLNEQDERAGSQRGLDDVRDDFPANPPTEVGASSMSGFGAGMVSKDTLSVKVSIKTLNARFFDVSIKAPRFVQSSEVKLTSYLRAQLLRGKVLVTVEVKDKDVAKLPIKVDADAVHAARSLLEQVASEAGLASATPTLDQILRFSEVFVKRENGEAQDGALKLVEEAMALACEDLKRARRREGYVLQLDLLRRCKNIDDIHAEISSRLPDVLQREKAKVESRVQELRENGFQDTNAAGFPEYMMASRIDISEEMVRLKSHLSMFKVSFFSTRPIGQKLNFLLQELHRETATISTKATDATISQLCVLIKEEVESIREQVQNLV